MVESIHGIYGVHAGHRAAPRRACSAQRPSSRARKPPPSAGPPTCPGRRCAPTSGFSNGSGDPAARRRSRRSGHGREVLPAGLDDDGSCRLSLPAFFARTPEDLLAFNEARRVDPTTGQPDLARVGAYLAEHPEAMTAVNAAITLPIPASYAAFTYHAIHAYRFEAADGTVRHGRYHLVPEDGEHRLTDEEAARPPDYLRDELRRGSSGTQRVFRLDVEVAEADDPVDDPTAVWPDGRTVVELGRLEITGLAFDRDREGDVLVFDPTRVTDGIGLTADPILLARPGAYSISVAERTAAPTTTA